MGLAMGANADTDLNVPCSTAMSQHKKPGRQEQKSQSVHEES